MVLKLTLYGHACALIDTGREKVLCDPHIYGKFASELFTIYPRREIDVERIETPDLIYLSHHHRDHFDLRSLAAFDRDTKVLFPDSAEIAYGLRSLGFRDVHCFRDWERYELQAASLYFTPSRIRVPENGLLVVGEDEVLWNLVDTVPDLEVFARVRSRLGGRAVDLLLWPYQPLMETSASESSSLRFPREKFEAALDTLAAIGPRYVVPYADAQFGTESTAWLNHYRFPVEFTEISAMVAACVSSQVVELGPGQRLIIDGERLSRGEDADYIRASASDALERSFDSTEPAPCLRETELGPLGIALRPIEEIVAALAGGWRALSARGGAMLAIAADWGLTYDLILETADSEVAVVLTPGDSEPAFLAAPPPDDDRNRVVLRMPLGVLEKILFGELHLVSAIIAGLVRSWHRVFRIANGVLVEAEWLDEYGNSSTSDHGQVASGNLLLNFLVSMSNAGLREAYLDNELKEANRATR